ncbi:unnamed protein product, partial [Rotaria sp. Silwood1]
YRRIARRIWEIHELDELSYDGLLSLSKRTLSRGTLEDRPRVGRPRTVRSIENIEQIKQKHFHQHRNPGQRSTAIDLGMALSSVNCAIKIDLKLKPFHKFKSTKMTVNNVKNRIQSAKILLSKYGGRPRSKKFLWNLVVNSDHSGKIGLTVMHNTKNNVVYGISRESMAYPNFANKTFANWTFANGESPVGHWRYSSGLSPIGESYQGILAKMNTARIVIKKGTMTSQKYIDLLQEKIMPSIEQLYPNDDYIYQDDCDSIHRSKIVLDFIKHHIPNRIMTEDQASKLDDVWPIENIWSIIRMNLKKKDYQDLFQVKAEIVKIWKNFDINLCAKMMSSIPKRLQAVIKKKGGRILKIDYLLFIIYY